MSKNNPKLISDPSDQPDDAQARKPRAALTLGTDAALASAIILLEVATAEHRIDKFSRGMVLAALTDLFHLSDASANAVLGEATNHLRNMRGSTSEAHLLRDNLDPITKRALAQVIDNIIKARGDAQGIEIYLRQRFRAIMGLPEGPLTPEG